MPCAIVALCCFYLSFLCFGLLVWIWSRPYGLGPHPNTVAYIKWFLSPLFCMSMLTCFYALFSILASLVLCFATFDALWRFVVVRFDAHKALCGCNHLGGISGCRVASCIPFPFSAPCVDMLTMLVCTTSSLSMHLYMLTYMSMHESYLLVCRSYFNTMKLWTFDTNLHLSLTDTTFCLLVCLFACLSCCL